MSKDKLEKTNAARILDGLGVPYELRAYAVDEDDLSADDDIAEEVYSLDAESYHSDADDFDELGGGSDKSADGDKWVRAAPRANSATGGCARDARLIACAAPRRPCPRRRSPASLACQ